MLLKFEIILKRTGQVKNRLHDDNKFWNIQQLDQQAGNALWLDVDITQSQFMKLLTFLMRTTFLNNTRNRKKAKELTIFTWNVFSPTKPTVKCVPTNITRQPVNFEHHWIPCPSYHRIAFTQIGGSCRCDEIIAPDVIQQTENMNWNQSTDNLFFVAYQWWVAT